MSPECRTEPVRSSLAVTTTAEPGSLLLEQWTVAVLPASTSSGSLMTSLALLQAVRSYLHFSQVTFQHDHINRTISDPLSPQNSSRPGIPRAMVAARGTYLCGSPSPGRSLPPSLPNLQSRTTSPLPELVPDQLLPSPFGLSLERKTRPWCCAATSTDMPERTRRLGSKVRPARCLSIHLQKTCDARWAKLVLPPRTLTAPAVSPSRIPSTPCLATVFLTPHKTSQRWHRDATNPRAGSQPA